MSNQYPVSIVRCNDYADTDLLYQQVKKSVDLLGGMKKFVKHGNKVLLKPNLLSARAPESAVTTHPAFVGVVARLVAEAGGTLLMGDSPGEMIFDSSRGIQKVIAKTGMLEIIEKYDIEHIVFQESAHVKTPKGCLFKELEIAREMLGVDVVINLPKLKTHSQMLMTLAVKNLFGAVVGKKKVQWHYKAGRDRQYFASMLVDIYKTLNPALTIMDGILGMEGNGPGSSGTPRKIGLILAGSRCIAIDRVVTELLQIPAEKLPTLKVSIDRKDAEVFMENIEISGERIEDNYIKNFKFPDSLLDLEFGPKLFRTAIKNSLTYKPVTDKSKCTLCGSCAENCPTNVIKVTRKKLTIDYSNCIQCYCCIEICPEAAMKTKKGIMTKLVE